MCRDILSFQLHRGPYDDLSCLHLDNVLVDRRSYIGNPPELGPTDLPTHHPFAQLYTDHNVVRLS